MPLFTAQVKVEIEMSVLADSQAQAEKSAENIAREIENGSREVVIAGLTCTVTYVEVQDVDRKE